MQIIQIHPTGNRNVAAMLAALVDADMLAEFDSTLAISDQDCWPKMLPGPWKRELARRTYPVPASKLKTYPYLELARIMLPKLGLGRATRHETGWASVDAVYKKLDMAVAHRLDYLVTKKQADAVYAYEDGALATFTKAKKMGLKCIYELPIAYWETSRQLMDQEKLRMPAWSVTMGGSVNDSKAKYQRKTRELELADIVVVPGKFVLDSLPGWAKHKQIVTAPFGSPPTEASNPDTRKRPGKLRVLFAGSMGQRKGLGDLFEAVRSLNHADIELVVMGSPLAPIAFYRQQLPDFTFEPGRPHAQVLALMSSCDLFCLPSIVEGRALVMQEAMSQGLAILITPNTGGQDLVIEGITGFLVPIRSPGAIAAKLLWCIQNRSALVSMGQNAKQHAAGYTWGSYAKTIIDFLRHSPPVSSTKISNSL